MHIPVRRAPQNIDEMFVFKEQYTVCEAQDDPGEGSRAEPYPFMVITDDMLTFCWKREDASVRSVASTLFSQVKFFLDERVVDTTITFLFGGKREIPFLWLQGAYPFQALLSGIEIQISTKYVRSLHLQGN